MIFHFGNLPNRIFDKITKNAKNFRGMHSLRTDIRYVRYTPCTAAKHKKTKTPELWGPQRQEPTGSGDSYSTSGNKHSAITGKLYARGYAKQKNKVMCILTISNNNLILLPLGHFLSGWYGMNFRNMPELQSARGSSRVIVIAVVSVTLQIIYFKKKKMFLAVKTNA